MKYDPMPLVRSDFEDKNRTATLSDDVVESRKEGKFQKWSFYSILAVIILTPLMFWSNPFIPLDLSKMFILSLGVVLASVLISLNSLKNKRFVLPPKSLMWISSLLLLSLIISSFVGINSGKSFFGQGIEINTTNFIIMMFVVGLAVFSLINSQKEKIKLIQLSVITVYLILFVYHFLRVIFGQNFMSLGIFKSLTSSPLGSWLNLGTFSIVIALMSLVALITLELTTKKKILHSLLLFVSTVGAILVMDIRIWAVVSLVLLGLFMSLSFEKWSSFRKSGTSRSLSMFIKSVSWPIVIAFILSVLIFYFGPTKMAPSMINNIGLGYQELVLPWQMTLDVTASTVKSYPLFGIGPNNFGQAYLAFKPLGINNTDFWSAEFNYGFGLIPTFVSTHGVVGSILWVLLFIFAGILSTKILRQLPQDKGDRYMLLSTFVISTFIWLAAFVTVPSNSMILYAFVMSGAFFGLATSLKILPATNCDRGNRFSGLFNSGMIILIAILVIWGLVNASKLTGLAYFGKALRELSVNGDLLKADNSLNLAIKFNNSDIYWRAKAEVSLSQVQRLANTITSTSTASTTQEVLTQITNLLNQGLAQTKNAIKIDPDNYYNYLSEARVSEIASNIGLTGSYENAVAAYSSAINVNPYNPSIYLTLANLESKHSKYDDAIRDLGRALQIKSNYLDAVFLLSQIYVAKGDINNATIASRFATQLNPQNPVLHFQLGMLNYSNKKYTEAVQSFNEATKLQPDYANAKYFLGLSEARLGNTENAIAQFEDLSKTNPENQEIALILANLKGGKSIFTDTSTQSTQTSEKRSSLPIKEKR